MFTVDLIPTFTMTGRTFGSVGCSGSVGFTLGRALERDARLSNTLVGDMLTQDVEVVAVK